MSYLEILLYISVVFSVLVLMYYVTVLKDASNYGFILLNGLNIVGNLGYAWLAFAKEEREALLAMRLTYLGGIFMIYVMFRIVCSVCRISFPSWLETILTSITICVYVITLNIGRNTLFYKSTELVVGDKYSYLLKEYGPLHNTVVYITMIYMLGALAAAVYSLFKPAKVARRTAIILALTEAFSIAVYFGERAAHLTFDLLPFSNCVAVGVVAVVSRKLFLYDADRAAQRAGDSNYGNGAILFDSEKRYLGSNKVARMLFPEIKEYHVEEPIGFGFKYKLFFERLINDFELSGNEEDTDNAIEYNDESYRVRVRRNIEADRGYIIELLNDTQAVSYMRQIEKINDNLETAIKDANAANIAKSNFLASMSHEIRTPINAVLGLNSIILRDTKEDMTREYSEDINSAGKSLLALINDILDFSKIEAGKMNLVPIEYYVSGLINDCQSMMYGKVRDKGLEFSVECDENVPTSLYGDEVRIRQVIINLLNNAVKYTEKGSVALRVSHHKKSEKRTELIIKVIDTGMGISETNQKHLFESFTRFDEARNRNVEGTGLGLTLVKKFVDMMGGTIDIESELEKGSTFTVTIPQPIVDETPVGKNISNPAKSSDAYKMDELSEVSGKILVVDDVKVNLKVFVHLLSKSKLTIDTAESGEEAIEKTVIKKYDVIYMDHMMPGMDGVEALHRIKDDPENVNRETPVVVLTANAIAGMKEQYLGEGFDEYLSKPINFAPLKDSILRYIGK